jgi:hypothetical protein
VSAAMMRSRCGLANAASTARSWLPPIANLKIPFHVSEIYYT